MDWFKIDLLAYIPKPKEKNSTQKLSRNHFAKLANTNCVDVSVPAPRSYVIKTLQNKLIEDWESWWSTSKTGLRVKSFFSKPSLDINPHSSYVTQFLTNHSPFVSYLHRLKLKTTPNCLRGSVADADHYVFACPLTKDFHLVSPSQNAKRAWFLSIVRNPSIHSKLNHVLKLPIQSGITFLRCDEAHFWLNGYVNKQNCRIWSEANPQVYVETPLHPEKLTVWCTLWAGGILLQKR
ncbi:RNase H domain-containing protein [Trichonephila clavipes]|nr:RNase H domain-containing protein [Trichonephila clavipes]